MSGLLVIACVATGGALGGGAGFVASLLWADMDIASLEPLMWTAAGTVAGALAGGFVGGLLAG